MYCINNMITIPTNLYEEHLSMWIHEQLNKSKGTEEECVLSFLMRLSRCQMIDRQRGEMFPYIINFNPSEKEISIIQENSFEECENIEIRAYCLDLKQKRAKDKRQPQIDASLAYLALYKETKSPWFLLRAITVRSIKAIKNIDFVKEVCICLQDDINTFWFNQICTALRKSYNKEDLVEVKSIIEIKLEKVSNPQDLEYRNDERNCLMALEVLGAISKNELHKKMAISFEKEVDYLNSIQDSHTIYMGKEQLIQNAYNEISKVVKYYPKDFIRIRNKLIEEQTKMKDNISKFGIKYSYSINPKLQSVVKEDLKKNPIDTPYKLIGAMKAIPFTDSKLYDKHLASIKNSSTIWDLFGSSMMGDKGQTVGIASPEEALNIQTHRIIRFNLRYIITAYISNFLNHEKTFDEILNVEAIVKTCNSSYIPERRRVLWAQGIMEMIKDNCVASAHILMPQIEYALLKKAEYYCGSQTKLEREKHQDEPSLGVILEVLKPHFKEFLYDEFRFFFNTGADSNVRNKLAHGLCDVIEIMGFAPYLWWLAIKMYWCDNEIFQERQD